MNDPVIAIAQFNPILGDLAGNTDRMLELVSRAVSENADLIVFPELAVSGYPPQDLLFDRPFIEANEKALKKFIPASEKIHIIIGSLRVAPDGTLRNSAAVLGGGQLIAYVDKTLLPTYDVFDEQRYFTPGVNSEPVEIVIRNSKLKLGIEICEDLWDDSYPVKVSRDLAEAGAMLFINISASPFSTGKSRARYELVLDKVRKYRIPFIYNNLVGAQDELIFDGNSFVLDSGGGMVSRCPAFRETLEICRIPLGISAENPAEFTCADPDEELFAALSTGIRDYFRKTGFSQCLLGLSGGIDSALVAVLAADALGPQNVWAYSLPSSFSSGHSLSDAEELAENLGIHYDALPIMDIYSSFMNELEPRFEGLPFGLAEENLQARIRGTLLMSMANKFNRLLLSTANKTEAALGYSTLYGDMAGALSPIADLNKLDVYALSRYCNKKAGQEIIPRNILEKRPSAELSEGQYDPFDYDIVSPLVEEILENRRSFSDLVSAGYEESLVRRIMTLINRSEYKRKQAAPGLRVTEKAFGTGRRMPIVNRFSDTES